jgi:uncharacterized protein (DUF1800 family)
MKSMLRLILLGAVIALASCGGNKELKKDAKNIAVAMCRNIETMNKLRAANPADSAKIKDLRSKEKDAEVEMTILYQEFKAKYKEKVSDPKFSKEFAMELRKAMLDCPYLSREDRANFEKERAN